MRNMKSLTGMGVVVCSLAAMAGCAGGKGAAPVAVAQGVVPEAKAPPRVMAMKGASAAQGSTVVLGRAGDRTLAFVGDDDDGVLHVVDVGSGDELSATPIAKGGGELGQMVLGPDGLLYVALRGGDRVQAYELTDAGGLSPRGHFTTAAEPVGVTVTPDGKELLVSSAWGQTLAGYRLGDGHRTFYTSLPREPRSIVVSDDGSKAYVSHVVGGRLSVVDLRKEHGSRDISLAEPKAKAKDDGQDLTGRARTSLPAAKKARSIAFTKDVTPLPRMGCQGFALAKSVEPPGRVLAPQVLVETGDTTEQTSGYGSGGSVAAEVASVAVVDSGNDQPLAASLKVKPTFAGTSAASAECLLPRAAVTHGPSGGLFVACVGIDAVVEYAAGSVSPRGAERRRWSVAAGPTGLAVDEDRDRLVVWSQFDHTLSVLSLRAFDEDTGLPTVPVRIALSQKAGKPTVADLALGRRLFHSAGDRRISADGRACASCHPDGRDDSLTWATPDGPRQTPTLAGRLAGTAPYGWMGNGDSVQTHLHQTFQRLRGSGLKGKELESLVAYVNAMPLPSRAGHEAASPEGDDLVTRGKELFTSAATECSTCHAQGGSDGMTHDIGTKATADRQGSFNTPSLRGLAGSAPYFHDGRYGTLRELLVASDGTMGHTSQLAPQDMDALEAYLRSL